MAEHLEGLMSTSMQNIRELVDVNTIIGDPIVSPEGTVIIPVSKVSFGFVAGGSDIPSQVTKEVFAGGSGAGITIKPQAFIVIKKDGNVELLELGGKDGGVLDGLVAGIPDFIAKIKAAIGKKPAEDAEDAEEDAADAEEDATV